MALRLAKAAALPGLTATLGLFMRLERLALAVRGFSTLPLSACVVSLQPQPQPDFFSGLATSAETAAFLLLGTRLWSRVLSLEIAADLPLTDIALRRARDAARLELAAGAATRGRAAEADDDLAAVTGAVLVTAVEPLLCGALRTRFACTFNAALPPLDIALRLANAAALLLF